MAENNGFIDPLENIINKTRSAYGIPEDTPTPVIEEAAPLTEEPVNNVVEEDDEFGLNDFQKELDEEEARMKAEEEARRQALLAERKANEVKQTTLPPRSLDKEFQKQAIDFQAGHLAVITGMIEQVKAKYQLHGGIPQEKLRAVEGDLTEIYYRTGGQVTTEFEQIILNNWQHVDPSTGEAYQQNNAATPNPTQQGDNQQEVEQEEDKDEPVTVNINVQPETDVTVNIDESIVGEMTHTNVVNVHVREVTDQDLRRQTIIENPQMPGIIRPYESAINDVPVTLPLSGYRCTIRPVNWFETIDLVAPSTNSKVDFQIQRWSIIYNHIKNVSIGEFKDFEDFLRKTKFGDMPILEWAILVATADEEEPIDIKCGNPKCMKHHNHNYVPRTLIHMNEDRIPAKYHDVFNAAPGEPAIKLFNEINTKRTRYQLPNTGIIVEMAEPSAWDYINEKLPMIINRYKEKRPDDPNMEQFDEENLGEDPRMYNFSYKIICLMRISAISVPDKNDPNKEYRFTNIQDIENVIDHIKIMQDSMLLVKLASDSRDMAAPADFYLEHIVCPYCGRVDERIYVNNIIQNLLFRISRRLESMEVNLIPLD